MRLVVIGLLAWTLSACASSPKQIRASFDPFIGQPINTLIGRWGPPTSVFPLANNEGDIYTWIYAGEESYTTRRVPYTSTTRTTADQNEGCRFDWTTNARGIVTTYRWYGACRVVR